MQPLDWLHCMHPLSTLTGSLLNSHQNLFTNNTPTILSMNRQRPHTKIRTHSLYKKDCKDNTMQGCP